MTLVKVQYPTNQDMYEKKEPALKYDEVQHEFAVSELAPPCSSPLGGVRPVQT